MTGRLLWLQLLSALKKKEQKKRGWLGRKKKMTAKQLDAERLTMNDGMMNDKRDRERKNEKKKHCVIHYYNDYSRAGVRFLWNAYI